MKFLFTLSLFIFLFISASYSQKIYTTEKDVFDASQIIFFGYDYTKFRMADRKRINQNLKGFMVTWIGYHEKKLNQKRMAKWMSKDTVIFNFRPTNEQNYRLESSEMVAADVRFIPSDSLQSYINSYDIEETQGVGLVAIMECFNKSEKLVSIYFVFFDIATRNILMSDYRISKDGNSYSRVTDWSTAVGIAFTRYSKIYQHKLERHNRVNQY